MSMSTTCSRLTTAEKREEPIPYWLYQSVVNKAPIDARTNRSIGGRAPSIYLPNLEERAGKCLGAILDSYGIDIRMLERDQFAKFFVRRGQEMPRWIADAMGEKDRRGYRGARERR